MTKSRNFVSGLTDWGVRRSVQMDCGGRIASRDASVYTAPRAIVTPKLAGVTVSPDSLATSATSTVHPDTSEKVARRPDPRRVYNKNKDKKLEKLVNIINT